jgi:hypothetical protein
MKRWNELKKRTTKLVYLAVLESCRTLVSLTEGDSRRSIVRRVTLVLGQRCPSLNARCLLNRVPAARVSRTRGELNAIRDL